MSKSNKIFDIINGYHDSWLIPEKIATTETAVLIFHSFGGILETSMVISFVYFLFCKKLSEYHGFLILLSIGYLTDLIALFCWYIDLGFGYESEGWINAAEVSFLYAITSGGLWNALICLNRCVAVLWPAIHLKYWSVKHICVYCIPAILVYPLLLQGYLFFEGDSYHQGFSIFMAEISFLMTSRMTIGISNTLLASVMLIMTTIVYIKNNSPAARSAKRWNHKMLLHCVFSSFFMLAFSISYWLAAVFRSKSLIATFLFEYLALLMYGIFHYGSILILLIINPTIRKSIFRFYFCWKKPINDVVRVPTISNTTIRRGSHLSIQRQ